jgi:hypothetical protein
VKGDSGFPSGRQKSKGKGDTKCKCNGNGKGDGVESEFWPRFLLLRGLALELETLACDAAASLDQWHSQRVSPRVVQLQKLCE